MKSATTIATDAQGAGEPAEGARGVRQGAPARCKEKKKKSHKGRNAMLLAGLVAGALYNPWTGPQTREWLLDKIAGDDDLQPLEGFDLPDAEVRERSRAAANGRRRGRDGRRRGRDQRELEASSGLDRRSGSFGARPARVASSAPGTRPLVLGDVGRLEQDGARGRATARP